MSCILLDIALADINVIKGLGTFIDGKVQGYPFCLPNKYKSMKKHFDVQETCKKFCGTEGVWITVRFSTLFRYEKGENFAEGGRKRKICRFDGVKRAKK